MSEAYDDPRWGALRNTVLAATSDAIGSAHSARTELNRRTMMANITVKDFNLEVLTGATCTGTGGVPGETWVLTVGKSLAGTGAFAAFGTASVGTAGQADDTVLNGSVTETNLNSGDDLVFAAEIGTALGSNALLARANISYVERYVGS